MIARHHFKIVGCFILLLCTTRLFQHISCYTVDDANKLHTDLFTGYNTYVIPEYPVTVEVEFNLLTINSVDIKSETFSTTGWFTVVWNDSRLAWNQSAYGDIEHIYTAEIMVWHPSFIIENSVADLTNLGNDNTQVRIRYDGQVRWEPAAILATSCDIDVTYFPFDLQSCEIELASWGFHTDALVMTFNKENVNIEDYTTNGEWNLISTSQNTTEIIEDDMAFSGLTFRIMLERLPGHYIMSVIFPVILPYLMTAVTFLLPVESGEKVGYILTVLLALAVLLTLFADSMPTTSKHTSILVVFLSVTLGFASLVIIITILIIRLHHKPEDYTVPRWIHRMVRAFNKGKCRKGDVALLDAENNSKVAWEDKDSSDKIEKIPKYSNQEIAHFFDNFFFILFVVVYIVVVLYFTITLCIGQ